MSNQHGVQATIGAIYDAALKPQQWSEALARVGGTVHAPTAYYLVWDTHSKTAPAFEASPQQAQEWQQQYKCQWIEHDPRLAHLAQTTQGTWVNCQDLFDHSDVARSAFYQQFALRHGLRHFLGMRLAEEGGLVAFIALLRPDRMPAFDAAAERRLAPLTEPLQRAAGIHLRLFTAAARLRALEDLANTLSGAVLLVSRNCTLKFANRVATALLSDPLSPLTTRHTKLAALTPAATTQLAQHARQAADHGVGHALRLPSPSSGSSYNLLICPLAPRLPQMHAADEPLVMLLLSPSQPRARLHASTLRALFGLTAAEATLGLALLHGQQLDEYSASKGVSMTTLRSQVKQLLMKTGARRQAELVSILAAVPTVGARMKPRHATTGGAT